MTAATAVVAAGLFTAPGASARFTSAEATASLGVAWHYWHSLVPERFELAGFQCGLGSVQIDWRPDLGTAMATAAIGGCFAPSPSIRLEGPTVRGLGDIRACGVITHEYGHLLGYAHVSDPEQVMSGEPGPGIRPPAGATWKRAWARCRRAL